MAPVKQWIADLQTWEAVSARSAALLQQLGLKGLGMMQTVFSGKEDVTGSSLLNCRRTS